MMDSCKLEETGSSVHKRHTNLANMQSFYDQWKASGLSKAAFARQAGLSSDNFYYWCQRLSTTESKIGSKKSNFKEITITKKATKETTPYQQETIINIEIGNQVQVSFSMAYVQLPTFLKELVHAINAFS